MSLISQFYNHPQKVTTTAFSSSGSYSPPVDAWHWFVIAGGGGGGACVVNATSTGWWRVACGGNGGSVRFGWVFLKAAETYTITIGSGGSSIVPTTTTAQSGNAGSESKMTGGDLVADIVAKGGKGGTYLSTQYNTNDYSTTPVTYENAANDAGSGLGSEGLGGKGGKVTLSNDIASGDYGCIASGGGAANAYVISPANIRGGDIDKVSFGPVYASSGGGGTGGTGGDIADADSNVGSSGGGTAGDGQEGDDAAGGLGSSNTGLVTPGGAGGKSINDPFTQAESDLIQGGDGSGGGAAFPDGPGDFDNSYGTSGSGGTFGGGAGGAHKFENDNAGNGGAYGGGGGGIASADESGPESGAGGSGLVYLEGYFSPSS